jgi:hypothetical protein
MTTRMVLAISAAVEVLAGLVLIASPTLFVQLLLRANLSDEGVAVGRVGGFALLSLGLACWPARAVIATRQSTWALFTYNLLTAIYLVYLGVSREFVGFLLWPACALHALLALLLAHPVYEAVRRERLAIQSSKAG